MTRTGAKIGRGGEKTSFKNFKLPPSPKTAEILGFAPKCYFLMHLWYTGVRMATTHRLIRDPEYQTYFLRQEQVLPSLKHPRKSSNSLWNRFYSWMTDACILVHIGRSGSVIDFRERVVPSKRAATVVDFS